jgi:ribosome-binding factor A
MTLVGHRHERIAEEIHHEIDIMLAGELKDPRLETSMTVTEVRVTPDLKKARIYVAIEGTPKEQADALKGLEAAAGYIRRDIAERLRMRRYPELKFIHDHSIKEAERIEELLRQVAKPAALKPPTEKS